MSFNKASLIIFVSAFALTIASNDNSSDDTHDHNHMHGANHTHDHNHTHGTDHTHGHNHTHGANHTHNNDHKHAPTLPGKCPDFPLFASLDISKLNGEWYATACLKNGFNEDHGHTVKCLKETIAARSDGSVEADVVMHNDDKVINKTFIAEPVKGKTAQFTLEKAHSKHEHGMDFTITIIDTDHTGYMISALCQSDAEKHGYMYELFSRSKTSPPADVEKAQALLKKLNIHDKLVPIEQNC